MADTFVKMVEFRASGLDEINSKLNTVNAVQNKLTGSVKEYKKAIGDTVRTMRQQERLLTSGVYQRRLQQTKALVREQDRLNRLMQREQAIARYGRLGGAVAYYGSGAGRALAGAGRVAGNAAAGALAMGVSGMQGTVPMARLTSNFNRLSYEVGNTLTPVVDRLANALEKSANWMEKRPKWQQDAIGYSIAGGAALRFAGRPALAAMSAAAPYAGKAIRGAGAMASLPGALLTAGLTVGGGAIRTKYNFDEADSLENRLNRGDLSQEKGLADSYQQQFAGLQGAQRKAAIAKELQLMNKIEAAGIDKAAGPNNGSFLGRVYDQVTFGNSGTGMMNEARQRQAVLRNMMGGGAGYTQTASDHEANARVGGKFQALGSGYEQAYGALAESGFNVQREQAEAMKEMNAKMTELVNAANELRAKQGLPPLQR